MELYLHTAPPIIAGSIEEGGGVGDGKRVDKLLTKNESCVIWPFFLFQDKYYDKI